MKYIDLHTHSTASDGSYAPAELVFYGKERGLSAMALTDHDTVAGLKEALEAGRACGLEVIPGVEITAVVEDCDVHIVGLFIEPDHSAIQQQLKLFAEGRNYRNQAIIEKLQAAGYNISSVDFEPYRDRTITRGHIASILSKRGYARDNKDAIARYMTKGAPTYVVRETPPPEDCIEAIHCSGGLAFVAHVNQIAPQDTVQSIAICKKVIAAGADGLETLYCEYDAFWEEATEAIAREYNLLRSGGSDFHGAIKQRLDLGSGYGNLAVPAVFLDRMKEALKMKQVRQN